MTACGLMFSHTQRVYKMCKGLPPAWALNYVILRLRIPEREQLRECHTHLWFLAMTSTQNGWRAERMHMVSGNVKMSRFCFTASCTSQKPLLNSKQMCGIGAAWLYHWWRSTCLWPGYSLVALLLPLQSCSEGPFPPACKLVKSFTISFNQH